MRSYTYTIHLEPEEEGGYVVTVPALPGCVTYGKTYHEALAMAHDAIEGYLQVLADDGESIPEETRPMVSVNVEVKAPARV